WGSAPVLAPATAAGLRPCPCDTLPSLSHRRSPQPHGASRRPTTGLADCNRAGAAPDRWMSGGRPMQFSPRAMVHPRPPAAGDGGDGRVTIVIDPRALVRECLVRSMSGADAGSEY